MTVWTLGGFHKRVDKIMDWQWESNPEVIDGRLYLIVFMRNGGGSGTGIRVLDYFTLAVVADIPCQAAFGCTLVENGQLIVFAQIANIIVRGVIDTSNWTMGPLQTVFTTASNYRYFSIGVTKGPQEYFMVAERHVAGQGPYDTMFFRSTDGIAWTQIPTTWRTGMLTGSPELFGPFNGQYYLTWVNAINAYGTAPAYITVSTRMADLANEATFEQSLRCVMGPDHLAAEATSCADLAGRTFAGHSFWSYAVDTQGNGPPNPPNFVPGLKLAYHPLPVDKALQSAFV